VHTITGENDGIMSARKPWRGRLELLVSVGLWRSTHTSLHLLLLNPRIRLASVPSKSADVSLAQKARSCGHLRPRNSTWRLEPVRQAVGHRRPIL